MHLAYGALTVAFGSTFVDIWSNSILAAISGVALLAFAARMLVRVVVLDSESDIKTSLASSFFGAIGFGLFNPITPLLFAAAAPVLLDRGDALPVLVVGGLFLGSLSW